MENSPRDPDGHRDYLSYLMRLWRVREDGTLCAEAEWRASLESAQTGARESFGGPMELFAFLREQMGLAAEGGNDESDTEEEGVTTVMLLIHRGWRSR
jgi:hypothetical protein